MKRNFILYFIAAVLLAIVFTYLFPIYHPLSALKTEYSKTEILEKGIKIAEFIGVDTEGYTANAHFGENRALIKKLRDRYGLKESNKLIRNNYPGYYWKINLSNDELPDLNRINDESNIKSMMGNYRIELDLHGRLLKIQRNNLENLQYSKNDYEYVKKRTKLLVKKYSGLEKIKKDTAQINNKDVIRNLSISFDTDEGPDVEKETIEENNDDTRESIILSGITSAGDTVLTETKYVGNQLISFKTQYLEYDSPNQNFPVYVAFTSVVMIIIAILYIIFGILKIRAYELGFKNGLIIAVLVMITSGIAIYMQLNDFFRFSFLIPVIFGSLFLAIIAFVVWSVTESVSRERFKDKFKNFDLIINGYWLNSNIGKSLLYASFYAIMALALSQVIMLVLSEVFNLNYFLRLAGDKSFLSASSYSLFTLNRGIYFSIFSILSYVVFMISLLRYKLKNKYIIIPIVGIIWAIGPTDINFTSIANLMVDFSIGVIAAYLFFKFDIITVIFFLIFKTYLLDAYALIQLDEASFQNSGLFIFINVFALIAYAVITLLTKDKDFNYDKIKPAFEKNISERQRLESELQIANEVQMSFLPKEMPKFNELDVYAECIPANEVGGDYYDFINLNHNKLGVVIGDVSGKGTKASFYMTLAKGLFRASAKDNENSSSVLKKVNGLFYENVERGIFISMAYSIFNLEKSEMITSRAGHDPIIYVNDGDVKILESSGIAIGLEKGNVFNENIEETSVNYKPGDVFIFYTDGYTEAKNKKKMDFGLDRLLSSAKEIDKNQSAEEIVEKLRSDLYKFTGKTQQNDDQTIIVVKVN